MVLLTLWWRNQVEVSATWVALQGADGMWKALLSSSKSISETSDMSTWACLVKRVLRLQYLLKCEEAGKWLDEREFEWNAGLLNNPDEDNGNNNNNNNTNNNNNKVSFDAMESLAAAARYWRVTLQDKRQQHRYAAANGAFSDFRVIVHTGDRSNAYIRLVHAGSGIAMPYKQGIDLTGVTHAFFDGQAGMEIWSIVEEMSANRIPCFTAKYVVVVVAAAAGGGGSS
jgi:hypothetical protein